MSGYYCDKCGAIQPLVSGVVTCRVCGLSGLRGFNNNRPLRCACSADVKAAWTEALKRRGVEVDR